MVFPKDRKKLYVKVFYRWLKYGMCCCLPVLTSQVVGFSSNVFPNLFGCEIALYRGAVADYCVMIVIMFL